MESSHVRWLIAGLFLGFLAIMVVKDLLARLPRSQRPAKPRHQGFRAPRPDDLEKQVPANNWKVGTRR